MDIPMNMHDLGVLLFYWLVVKPPLWKMMEWKSVGMMTFLTEWENNPNVPNHQPDQFRWLEYLEGKEILGP